MFDETIMERYKTLMVEYFDSICVLDGAEMKYLDERVKKAEAEGKDGLVWEYDVLAKLLKELNRKCFRSILFGLKGSKQISHKELPLHDLMVSTKQGSLPGNHEFMQEVVEKSGVALTLKKHFNDKEVIFYPSDITEGLSKVRVVVYLKDKAAVEPLFLDGTADMDVLKTA